MLTPLTEMYKKFSPTIFVGENGSLKIAFLTWPANRLVYAPLRFNIWGSTHWNDLAQQKFALSNLLPVEVKQDDWFQRLSTIGNLRNFCMW